MNDHHDPEITNGHSHVHNGHEAVEDFEFIPDEIKLEHVRTLGASRVNLYREAGQNFLSFFDQVLVLILESENPRLATMCIAQATGRRLISGGIAQTEIAEKMSV